MLVLRQRDTDNQYFDPIFPCVGMLVVGNTDSDLERSGITDLVNLWLICTIVVLMQNQLPVGKFCVIKIRADTIFHAGILFHDSSLLFCLKQLFVVISLVQIFNVAKSFSDKEGAENIHNVKKQLHRKVLAWPIYFHFKIF